MKIQIIDYFLVTINIHSYKLYSQVSNNELQITNYNYKNLSAIDYAIPVFNKQTILLVFSSYLNRISRYSNYNRSISFEHNIETKSDV